MEVHVRKIRWFRREPNLQPSGMDLFRGHILVLLSVLTFYDCWLLIPCMVTPFDLTDVGHAMLGWGTFLAAGTYLLHRHWQRPAAWLFVVGGLVWGSLILLELGLVAAMAHLVILLLASGLLLGPIASLLTGATSTGIILLLSPAPFSPDTAYSWAVLAVAIWAVTLITGRALGMMDHWERQLYVQQRELIGQLRERQGELRRTLKALDEAYVSLERTNNDLLRARQEAEEARAVEERFVANVSHELRTPLNLVVGFSEMMYLTPETYPGVVRTAEFDNDLRQLFRAGRHLQDLVSDVLDLSRIDASRLPIFRELEDVRPIITDALEAVSPLFQQRGLSCEANWPEELPELFIDRTRVRQVIVNLLSNALRFTDSGGVRIRVERTETSVVVSVCDTGVGIAENQLEHVFEEFRQADAGAHGRGGAGLGLAISRKFVQLHGGRMWVESEVGSGSVFSFSLPLPGTVPKSILRRTPGRRQSDFSDAPVVVIDPDPTIAQMLRRYLGDRIVLTAQDTDEAEAIIDREHPLAVIVNLPPDTPAVDWHGTLGEQSRCFNVPVLRCSLPSPSWLWQHTLLDDALTKPVSREALNHVLEKHCEKPGRVLIVDDDPGFVSLMARMLSTMELADEVVVALSGPQALHQIRESAPDLVLLDLVMPEMDGFEVLRALREDTGLQDASIVAVTATSYAEEVLHRSASQFTLSQSAGIATGTVVELLNATLESVRPDYLALY